MTPTKINIVYFSPKGTTKRIAQAVAKGTEIKEVKEYNILSPQKKHIKIDNSELTIFAAPIYAGRVPEICKNSLNMFKGNNSPAIAICSYGNRGIDDAMMEIADIAKENGFINIAAGSFVGEHSLFPKVAKDRPDKQDIKECMEFGANCIKQINNIPEIKDIEKNAGKLTVEGNKPYKNYGHVPFIPSTDKTKCNNCMKCVEECPASAINQINPSIIDGDLCISCGHCIKTCPENAKNYTDKTYFEAQDQFYNKNAARKGSIIFYRK